MKILVIDGQGGKMGALFIEKLRQTDLEADITAVGTNAAATSAMLRAGADRGATGENPVIVGARGADIIVGPVGILAADSLLGEITPAMAAAIGGSSASKLLIPVSRCNIHIAGVPDLTLSELIRIAVAKISEI